MRLIAALLLVLGLAACSQKIDLSEVRGIPVEERGNGSASADTPDSGGEAESGSE